MLANLVGQLRFDHTAAADARGQHRIAAHVKVRPRCGAWIIEAPVPIHPFAGPNFQALARLANLLFDAYRSRLGRFRGGRRLRLAGLIYELHCEFGTDWLGQTSAHRGCFVNK